MPIYVLGGHPIRLITLAIAVSGILAGCGGGDRPELKTVTGVVTFDGQPLTQASVVFAPKQGKSSRAFTDQQGRYDLVYLRDMKGAVIGPHTVRITTATEAAPVEQLPPRYHAQSDLTVEVEPDGLNEFQFELTSQP